ncbi:protein TIC 21, chloroplastic-like [Silene latifolia]|uniref:protein TIC 21, chloroplastic-like n=1 Tax=Silene latifolia TaxID=37657 RepID=UPI003D77831C
MQALLLPAIRPGTQPPLSAVVYTAATQSFICRRIQISARLLSPPSKLSSSSLSLLPSLSPNPSKTLHLLPKTTSFATSASPGFTSPVHESDEVKLAQVAKRLENTARYFKRLGSFGFWGQLICTIVAAVILSFSVVVTGKITSPATFYSTAGGIAAAFISVFWSFGYLRLSEKLRKTASNPAKAPPRNDVVKSLRNGIVVNILGMGAALLGMLATVGGLVAKALTTSTSPYYQGITPGSSPVLALDVFLVQASANTILSHFLGLVSSLELLRSVTLPPAQANPVAN